MKKLDWSIVDLIVLNGLISIDNLEWNLPAFLVGVSIQREEQYFEERTDDRYFSGVK